MNAKDPITRAAELDRETLLGAIVDVLQLSEHPDMTLTHPKGDKTFLIATSTIRATISKALNRTTP